MTERDVMEYDVLAVGAGPAGLAFAIRLKQLKPELSVCVIEKSSTIGAHVLSGAVIEPGPLDELLPGWREIRRRSACRRRRTSSGSCRKTGGFKLPIVPPQMNNHGNFIVSLGAMCAWLAPQAEALGVEIYPGLRRRRAAATTKTARSPASRIGDMGVARDGSHKPGLHAGHRHPGEDHRARRGRARPPDQARGQAASSWTTDTTRRTIRSASRNSGRCRRAA